MEQQTQQATQQPQPVDAFTQKRIELIVEMATKKLQQEITMLRESISSLNREISMLKSRPLPEPIVAAPNRNAQNIPANEAAVSTQNFAPKREVKIIDCRPDNERKEEFQSGAARNSEPVRPRYGNYTPEDVSIEKFFNFGRK